MEMSCHKQAILAGRLIKGMTFSQKVWALCARVPAGAVTTYGAIAKALKQPGASRAVGQALNKNPYAPQVPCHRVVGSDGRLTGFATGLPKKAKLLRADGIKIAKDRVDVETYYTFKSK